MRKLKEVLAVLIAGRTPPARFRDHPLKGEWKGCRDLHIEPDWILIYTADEETVRFERTGTHSDLFRE